MSRRRPIAYAVVVGLTVLLVPMVLGDDADAAEPPAAGATMDQPPAEYLRGELAVSRDS